MLSAIAVAGAVASTRVPASMPASFTIAHDAASASSINDNRGEPSPGERGDATGAGLCTDAGITNVTAGTAPAHPTPSAAAACASSIASVLASAPACASLGEHGAHAGATHVARDRGLGSPHSSRHNSACSVISTSHMRRAMACSTGEPTRLASRSSSRSHGTKSACASLLSH